MSQMTTQRSHLSSPLVDTFYPMAAAEVKRVLQPTAELEDCCVDLLPTDSTLEDRLYKLTANPFIWDALHLTEVHTLTQLCVDHIVNPQESTWWCVQLLYKIATSFRVSVPSPHELLQALIRLGETCCHCWEAVWLTALIEALARDPDMLVHLRTQSVATRIRDTVKYTLSAPYRHMCDRACDAIL